MKCATVSNCIGMQMILAPSPSEARCLSPAERAWLQRRQDQAAVSKAAAADHCSTKGASPSSGLQLCFLDTCHCSLSHCKMLYTLCYMHQYITHIPTHHTRTNICGTCRWPVQLEGVVLGVDMVFDGMCHFWHHLLVS